MSFSGPRPAASASSEAPPDARRAGTEAPGGLPGIPWSAPPAPPGVRIADRLPAVLRPHPNLLRYYGLSSLLFGPMFLFAILPRYFKYRSLRYLLDREGITMRWGVLFRREVSLTYARIQDIQLSSNLVERWLGLARIEVQTASGSASAEMVLEGLRDVDAMRDFLYARMRGGQSTPPSLRHPAATALGDPAAGDGGAVPGEARVPGASGEARVLVDPAEGGAPIGPGEARAGTPDQAIEELLAELTATLHLVAAEMRAIRLSHERDTGGGSDA